MYDDTLKLSENESKFIEALLEFLSSNGVNTKLIKIDRKSDNTLNFCIDHCQFGRIKLQGRKTKMQMITRDDVIWVEDQTFEQYIKNQSYWLLYIKLLGNQYFR